MFKKDSKKSTILYIMLGVILAFGINQGLAFALSTDMPVVAVESNSMCDEGACTFARGDLLILQGVPAEQLEIGDIIVYSVPNQPAPIVHRIIKKNIDGSFQTKGDANTQQLPFEKHIAATQIHGKEVMIIPLLGWVKIGLTEFIIPNTVWIIIAIIGIYAITKFKPMQKMGYRR